MSRSGPAEPSPTAVFISHASAERDVALAFKKALTDGFGDTLGVFVSSDDYSLTPGKEFNSTIKTAIQEAKIGIFLLSPHSIGRAWVQIEFGAFWGLDKPAVPIVHGGLQIGDLPSPIREMDAMRLDDKAALTRLVKHISREMHYPTPTVKFSQVIKVAQRREDSQKKTRNEELISALAVVARGSFLNVLSLLREGRQEFTVNLADQETLAAVTRLEEAELLTRREIGPFHADGVRYSRFTLEGTPTYTRALLTPEYQAGLRAQGLQVPGGLEIESTEVIGVQDRGSVVKRTVPRPPSMPALATAETPDGPPGLPADLLTAGQQDDTFQDYLDAHLPTGRRTALKTVLDFLTVTPAMRPAFRSWVMRDSTLLGQPWFVQPTLLWFLEKATNKELELEYAFLRALMGSLLDAGRLEEAERLYRESLNTLKAHTQWGNGHMNAVVQLTEIFWWASDRVRRQYASEDAGEEVQDRVTTHLEQTTRRVLREGSDTQVQELVQATASVVCDVREFSLVSILDHLGQQAEFVARMNPETVRQICNALDHARPGVGTEGVPQHRRVEHTYVDMIASDYLEAFRTRDDVSAEDFDWAVNRAGLHLVHGELTSRHLEPS